MTLSTTSFENESLYTLSKPNYEFVTFIYIY